MIDTHIHLSGYKYQNEFPFLTYENGSFAVERGNRVLLIDRLRKRGISACIEPAIGVDSIPNLLDLAKQYPGFLFPAVGVHPTRTFRYRTVVMKNNRKEVRTVRLHWNERRQIAQYAAQPGVIAIGETGLDYHLERKEQHRFRQTAWFLWQLHLEHSRKLPVILHVRDADRDALCLLRLLRGWLHGGVCHCFTKNAALAKQYTSLGLLLGIGGTLLQNTPERFALEDAVRQTPLEYLLLETDAPFVKPDCPAFTKKQRENVRNSSLILPAVAERIAALKQVPYADVVRITDENALRVFHLALSPDTP